MRLCFVVLLLLPLLAVAGTISFTFDDGFDPHQQPQAAQWNEALLKALKQAKVKAMLFPAGKRVDSDEGLALVQAWGEHGHRIGNHTYLHRNYGSPRVSFADFTADVMAAEALLEDLPGWTRRFRFPQLKEGDSADKRDRMRDWLRLHGYEPAPVSIATSDHYYDERWRAWRERHPQADATRFKEAYLNHLWGRANHYEALARQLLGRSPAHVMQLHTNAVNAEFLDDVIALFRRKGWRIVSPEEAYRDPLYRRQPNTVPAGESIVWSAAKKAGMKGLRSPPEDERYEKPLLDKRQL